jgi:asparagine synthetase B (glutamine-hydrolysing)
MRKLALLSVNERYVIAFNDVTYNYLELCDELEGITWRSTRILRFCCRGLRWGLKPGSKTVGMFAIALWGTQDRTHTLPREHCYVYKGVEGIFRYTLMHSRPTSHRQV